MTYAKIVEDTLRRAHCNIDIARIFGAKGKICPERGADKAYIVDNDGVALQKVSHCKGGMDFVSKHKEFGPMKSGGVSFYDVSAKLDINVLSHIVQVSQHHSKEYLEDEGDDGLLAFLMVSG